jgi:hypothetical protein
MVKYRRAPTASAIRSKDGEMDATSLTQQATPKDNRDLFIEAMADPIRRQIAFDVVERNCRMRFRVGEEGIRAYLQVCELVKLSKLDDAVEDFESRFLPMLDQKLLKKMVEEPHREQVTDT